MDGSVGSVFTNILLPLDSLKLEHRRTLIRKRLFQALLLVLLPIPVLAVVSLLRNGATIAVSTLGHSIVEVLLAVLSLVIIYAIYHEYKVSKKPSAYYLLFAFLWIGAGDLLELFSDGDSYALLWVHTLSVFGCSFFYFLCVRSLARKREVPRWHMSSLVLLAAAVTLVSVVLTFRASLFMQGGAAVAEIPKTAGTSAGSLIVSLSPLMLLSPVAAGFFFSGTVLLKHFRNSEDLVSLALSATALLFAENEILYCFSRPWTFGWWSTHFIKLIILTGLCYGIARALREAFYKLHESRERYKTLAGEVTRAYEDLRDTQEKLSETEKLASIGRLAATISHEVKNPLGAIKNAVSIFKNQRQCSGQEAELLDIVEKEINRLNKIVTDFLEFARPTHFSKAKTDLHVIIDDALSLLLHSGQEVSQLHVEREFDMTMPTFYMDRDVMKQVFLNIFLNSLQAMDGDGTLTIRTSYEEKWLNDRRYKEASIVIKDTGAGMTDEVLTKVFQPFFTTKTRGSGLGLSVVQRSVRHHGGHVSVSSLMGKGTTIMVSLPVE